MDIRTIITIKLPHTLVEALEITEDTPFIVGFSNNTLTIEPILNEDDVEDISKDYDENLYNNEYEEEYVEGFAEGRYEGYTEGYRVGYEDCESGRKYNDTYPEDDDDCYSN